MGKGKYVIAAAGLLALASFASTAQAKDNHAAWDGFLQIITSTPQCAGHGGTSPGDTEVSIFRPKIGSTDGPSFLSVIHQRAAITMENTSETGAPQMNGTGSYALTKIDSKAFPSSGSGTYDLTVVPATVRPNTRSVAVDGTIDNYFGHFGCTVEVHAAYVGGFAD